MDKNAIKKYAVWARRELIERVAKKAQQYGIEENAEMDANADSINGKLLTPSEKKERQALITQIRDKGYEQVMEEVAYTWFNRFSALRFMEVNGYLPTHVRVFTDDENNFKPQILTEAIHLELDGLDMEKVYELKDADKTDELYKYLLITQCNALNAILPGMFQKIADYTELLLPDNLLREGSAIEQMITLIPEEDWKDAVQIIGWLYQYYNSEKKDEVFAALKKNVKITKENIPAATQLFTPDWIVRYMVENSLGRLWVEGHPNNELKAGWKYYLDEAEQEADVQAQLDNIREEYKALKPEQIKCIDPCSGSGHILAYMFDVLMQIYEAYGYTSREAVASIVENNIYGLDIDERAAQLANFAVMMKARQYDRRFFSRKDEDGNLSIAQPNVYAICESNHISKECLDYFANEDAKLNREIHTLVDEMHDAKEYGSILNISAFDYDGVMARFYEIEHEDIMSLYTIEAITQLLPVAMVARLLSQKYEALVTNPPYMSNRGMSKKIASYIQKNYKDCKNDLFAVFIDVANNMLIKDGFYSMITQPSIISLSAFKNLRYRMITSQNILSIIHMGRGVFGIDFGSAAFVMRKAPILNYESSFCKLYERTFQYIEPEDISKIYLETVKNHDYKFDFSTYKTSIFDLEDSEELVETSERIFYTLKQRDFIDIPDNPFAYWMSTILIDSFKGEKVSNYSTVTNGLFTCDNNRFLRLWHEIEYTNFNPECRNKEDNLQDNRRWYPYNKGGNYRKWYGNHEYVVDFRNFGKDISDYRIASGQSASFPGQDYYFNESLSWSFISAAKFGIRYYPAGFVFDIAGSSVFVNNSDELYSMLAFLGSEVAAYALQILNPTMNYQAGNVRQLPIKKEILANRRIIELAKSNVAFEKKDWDAYETSWNFVKNPLVVDVKYLCDAVKMYETYILESFGQVKANEREINEIVINAYELSDVIGPEVNDKYITMTKYSASICMKNFISYAVGCMFGRYSLDQEGLIYAGGVWDDSKYKSFAADKDNIIPICSDEYFEDDITGRFFKFVETVYGKDTLQVNLQFIADALGGKGTPSEVIRNYFANDFYNDHCKMYQKRPIYWLFDSGKKGGFKALIYMHRYQQDTIARMRTDYVHEQQGRYRTEISDLETRIASATTSERVKLNKELSALQDKATEIREYEEKIHHLADQMIRIDLDDGVKNNYAIFQDVLAKIK